MIKAGNLISSTCRRKQKHDERLCSHGPVAGEYKKPVHPSANLPAQKHLTFQ